MFPTQQWPVSWYNGGLTGGLLNLPQHGWYFNHLRLFMGSFEGWCHSKHAMFSFCSNRLSVKLPQKNAVLVYCSTQKSKRFCMIPLPVPVNTRMSLHFWDQASRNRLSLVTVTLRRGMPRYDWYFNTRCCFHSGLFAAATTRWYDPILICAYCWDGWQKTPTNQLTNYITS